MKPILGLVAAVVAAGAFAAAYGFAVRPEANWLDMQWVFLVALPYNWTMLRLTGASDFSPDSATQIAAAAGFDIGLAFVSGVLAETTARAAWRALRGFKGRA